MTVARGRRRRASQAGLTLVEMMIALVIVSIAVAATLSLGFSLISSYREHRHMVRVEQAARASLEIIASAVRNSSPGVPSGNVYDLYGCTGPTSTDADRAHGALHVVNSSTGPDELRLIYAPGGGVSSLRADFLPGSSGIEVLAPRADDPDDVLGRQFQAGDYALVTSIDQGVVVRIADVIDNDDTWTLVIDDPPTPCTLPDAIPVTGYPSGSIVVRAAVLRLFVDDGPDVGGIPTLMFDPDGLGPAPAEPLAEGVEDLQIAVGIDVGGTGALVDNNDALDDWFYNDPGDADPASTGLTPRALRITVVTRSSVEMRGPATAIRPAIEDREGANESDAFRRRILSTVVEIRNLEGSP